MRQVFKNLLNSYLDTTPRQWLIFWAETFDLDYLNPGRQMRNFISSFKGNKGFGFALSLLLHAILLVLTMAPHNGLEALSQLISDDIKVDDKTLTAEAASSEFLEIKGVYYLDGTEKKFQKDQPVSQLSSLLKRLKAPSSAWASVEVPKKNTSNLFASRQVRSQAPQWKDVAMATEKTMDDARGIEDKLSRQIAKHDSKFQNCYEGALLKDASMNGRIEFTLKVGDTRTIDQAEARFEGAGLPESRQQLQNCLKVVASSLRFEDVNAEQIAGKKLKFYVVLRSH